MQFKVVAILLVVTTTVVTANPILNSFVDRFNLDAPIQTLIPSVDDLDKKLEQISECYESELVGQNVDLFDREATVKSIIAQYYQAFPDKTITEESVSNLINSITEITSSCLQTEFPTIRYGFTQLSDMSESQIRSLSGASFPSFNNSVGSNGEVFLSGGDAACKKVPKSIPASYDWRTHGVVTSIKNQGLCGSCWTFATAASIESAYLLHKKTTNKKFALSEQQILDCAKANGCQGGNAMTSFGYVKTHGITSYASYPYKGHDNHCTSHKYTAAAHIHNFCVRSKFRYTSSFHAEALTDHIIQQVLVHYGPVYVNLDANPGWTRNYRGGIVHGPCTTATNHAVLLVGYTSKSWIIKNSWGTAWGKAGYFELARNGNLCGIHTEIAFPLLS